MGFNRKSDAGPYEGLTGQQRYMSDVLFGYYPQLIDALNYNLFGCNAIFTEPSFKIHEAYGVNTTIEKGIVQPAQKLSFELDELDSNYNVAHDPTLFTSPLIYTMLTLSSYAYVDDTGNYFVNKFAMPSLSEIISTGTIQLLNLPVIYPWKFMKEEKGATDKMAFAGHQLEFPILYDNTTTVFRSTTIGNDVVKQVLHSEFQEPNNTISAKQTIGIGTKYLYGATTAEFSSTARWSTPNDDASHHIRSVKINFNNSGTNPFMLTIVAGPNWRTSGTALVKIPNGATTTLYAGTSESSADSIQYAYGFMVCKDPVQIQADIEDYFFGGSLAGYTITHSTQMGAALLYWICMHHIADATSTISYSHNLSLDGSIIDQTYSYTDFYTWLSSIAASINLNITDYQGLTMQWLIFKVFTAITNAKADDPTYFTDEIFTPKFTSNCTAEIGALDITEYGEDRIYGFVYGETDNEYHNALPRGFSDIELMFDETIPDMVAFTIGMYSDEWTSQGSTPGWRTVTISTSTVSTVGNDLTSYNAYQITLPSTATYIVDTVLYAGKFMTVVECSTFSWAGDEPVYLLNNILTGVADDFGSTPASYSYSGVSVLNQSGTGTTATVVYIDNLASIDKTISNPQIRSIISISETYDLTLVKFNINSAECYLGILNTETNRHYTPHNMFNCNSEAGYQNLIYNETPIVTSVKVIQSNPYSVSIIVKLDTGSLSSAVYMTLKQIKTIKGAVFITDPIHLDSYILESYHISIDNSVMQSEYPVLDNAGTNLGLSLYENAGIKKDIYPIEYDNNVVSVQDKSKHSIRLNISSVITLPSYNVLDSAVINISDISDFSSNAVKIPMLYPHEGLCITADDIGKETYAAVTGSSSGEKILNLSFYASRLMNYNPLISVNIGGKKRQLYSGSIILATLPGIDKNIKNYSVLPEKTNTLFKVSDIRLLDIVGFDYYSAYDKSYIAVRDNLFVSSRANLVPADYYGLFTLQGTIYGFGNYFLVTDNRQTFVYVINESKIPTLLKAVDGVALCDPVAIGEDLVIVCKNAIHSLKYGNLYNFEFHMTHAIIKPVTGNGYLLYAYSEDVTGDVNLVATNGDILTAVNGDVLSFTGLKDNIKCFNINDRLNIVELEYDVNTNDPDELKIIANNCYGNKLTVYLPEPGGAYSYKPSAYAMVESSTYHTNAYIISEPMQLRNQKTEVAVADSIFIYCKGQGQIEFRLYNGNVSIVDKTIDIGTTVEDEVSENKIELGMIPFDNLYYRIDIIPDLFDTTPKIEMVKIRFNNLQEP